MRDLTINITMWVIGSITHHLTPTLCLSHHHVHTFIFLFNKTPPHTTSQLLYATQKTAGDHAKDAKK